MIWKHEVYWFREKKVDELGVYLKFATISVFGAICKAVKLEKIIIPGYS